MEYVTLNNGVKIPREEYAPEYAFPPQNEEIVHTWVNPAAQYEEEKQEPVVHADTVYDNIPAPSQEQGGNAVKRAASHKSEAKPSPAAKDYTPSNPKDSSHMRTDDKIGRAHV